MEVFELVIALLLAGVVLAAIARRLTTPYPALVAIAGATLALYPRVPSLVLDPELALALFVAPVLLDAAFDASQRDLWQNWRTVVGLAVGAVVITVALVAVVAHALVPGLPWAAAIALGAIVAPPDAAAATAVLKQLRPPHRLLVILEGESLFNDASALLIYRLAVAAAAGALISGWSFAGTIVGVGVGSVVLGLVLARVMGLINPMTHDVPTAVIVQFCGTFAVWLLAERLHLSGILTMVIFAMAVSRTAAQSIPARIRVPSYAGVGGRGVRAEPARVHPRRLPIATNRRANRLDPLPQRHSRGLPRGDRGALRVGIGRCGAEPMALPPATRRR